MIIRISYNNSILRVYVNRDTHNRFGDKVSMTLRIPYNSGVSRVWVNGDT